MDSLEIFDVLLKLCKENGIKVYGESELEKLL